VLVRSAPNVFGIGHTPVYLVSELAAYLGAARTFDIPIFARIVSADGAVRLVDVAGLGLRE
jgi:hypothetical protein